MYTCIILHNMILKNQMFALSDIDDTYICPRANLARTWIKRCEVQRKQAKELRDKQTHARLQRNLIEHVWQQHLAWGIKTTPNLTASDYYFPIRSSGDIHRFASTNDDKDENVSNCGMRLCGTFNFFSYY
nr:hypothetical protein [Tanacetum cinerariifolium]